jgi:hypothetical protein
MRGNGEGVWNLAPAPLTTRFWRKSFILNINAINKIFVILVEDTQLCLKYNIKMK